MKTKINTDRCKAAHTLSTVFSFLFPVVTFAAFDLESSTFKTLVQYVLQTINILIPILFSLAFVVFFWGLSKFILNSNNVADIQKGKEYMMWGILALFILVSFRAIINFVADDLGIGSGTNIGSVLLPTS